MIERLQQFIRNEGISVRAFEQSISTSDGLIRRAITNKADIQSRWLTAIAEKYPHLNIEWLITGKGNMLRDSKEKSIPVAKKTECPTEGIPLIPINAMAGAFTSDQTVLEYECDRYIVPVFKGADFLIAVKGSSMMPKYNSGDIVACKRLSMSDYFFQWNKVYVLDTDQGPLIKRVNPGSDKDHILIVSENSDYKPFELGLDHIHNLALVIGVIRME